MTGILENVRANKLSMFYKNILSDMVRHWAVNLHICMTRAERNAPEGSDTATKYLHTYSLKE